MVQSAYALTHFYETELLLQMKTAGLQMNEHQMGCMPCHCCRKHMDKRKLDDHTPKLMQKGDSLEKYKSVYKKAMT